MTNESLATYLLILLGVFLGAAVILVVNRARSHERRHEALERLASERGWEYSRETDETPETFGAFELLRVGANVRDVSHLIRGRHRDGAFSIFDFTAGLQPSLFQSLFRGAHGHKETLGTVVVFDAASVVTPFFVLQATELVPGSLAARLAAPLLRGSVQFPERTLFATTYVLRGGSESDVRRLFDERVLDFFEAHPGWVIEGRENGLLVTRNVRRHPHEDWAYSWNPKSIKPEKIDSFLDGALEILEVFRGARARSRR